MPSTLSPSHDFQPREAPPVRRVLHLIGYPSHTHTGRHPLPQVQVEIKKGQTIMVDANLQQPPGALHKDVSERSGLPADTFELYHGSKRLEGEAVLASWGVEKDSLIEVKTRGRGGMHGGGGGEDGADGGGGVEGGRGGTDSCLRGVRGVDGVEGVDSGSSSGVGGGGAGGAGSGSGVGGADTGIGVAGGGVEGGGDAEGGGSGQESARNQDGKRPQNLEGKPPSLSKVHAEKQWLQNAKAAAELESEADHKALDIVAVTVSAARSTQPNLSPSSNTRVHTCALTPTSPQPSPSP